MTQDEKVAILKEAGVWDVIGYPTCIDKLFDLVAAHAKQEYIDSVYEQHRETMFSNKDLGMLVDAVKAEREACAKVCEELEQFYEHTVAPQQCAYNIRARSEQ